MCNPGQVHHHPQGELGATCVRTHSLHPSCVCIPPCTPVSVHPFLHPHSACTNPCTSDACAPLLLPPLSRDPPSCFGCTHSCTPTLYTPIPAPPAAHVPAPGRHIPSPCVARGRPSRRPAVVHVCPQAADGPLRRAVTTCCPRTRVENRACLGTRFDE